jgi:polysaccharide biosynthesis/export protein
MNAKLICRPAMALCALFLAATLWSAAWARSPEYVLSPGDVVRITVFQNPDLTTEARVSETGTLTFPLVGSVTVGGQSVSAAEASIAARLREGGFVLKPHVNILPLQMRGNQVVVLGQVERPGRYPLETFNQRLADMVAAAGGVAEDGSERVVLSGMRDGRPMRVEVDLASIFEHDGHERNVPLVGGDMIYVERAPVFYIYGQVQRPGVFRLERDMSVIQALAAGGGLTARGTMRGLRVHRRDESGKLQIIEPGLDDLLLPNDVVHLRESLF